MLKTNQHTILEQFLGKKITSYALKFFEKNLCNVAWNGNWIFVNCFLACKPINYVSLDLSLNLHVMDMFIKHLI